MKQRRRLETKQYQRYGIRKFSRGVASVMIASGLFFLGQGGVYAAEVTQPPSPEVPAETLPTTPASLPTEEMKADIEPKEETEEKKDPLEKNVTDDKNTTESTEKMKEVEKETTNVNEKAE